MNHTLNTIGQRLAYFIKNEIKITDKAFGETIDTSTQTVSNMLTDKTDISMQRLKVIAKKYPNLNLNWLTTGYGNMLLANNEESINGKLLTPMVTQTAKNNNGDVQQKTGSDEAWREAVQALKENAELRAENTYLKSIIKELDKK